jgi:hypothetical protein
MSFPSKNGLCIADNHAISVDIHHHLSLQTNNQRRTDILHNSGLWETTATCCYAQQDSSWVLHTCWQLIIRFWYEGNNIILRTFYIFSLSSSSPIAQQQMMETQPPQPGPSGSDSSRLTRASSNVSLIGALREPRHQSVHREAANAAKINMTQDAHLNIICKIGSSTHGKQHAVGCDYILTMVKCRQLTIYHVCGVLWELRDQFYHCP